MEAPLRIGSYAIDREIGRGGMGVVYRATDRRLDRSVAIKALPAEFANNPELMSRFGREARTLAALNHPNVGGIHGIEEHEGRKYLVLEYVDGETLADRLSRGPLRISEMIRICSQIAEGLAAAHDAGFIHRDLKPENVKITSGGVVKILDFGLARVEATTESRASVADAPTTGLSDTMTTPGSILGTARYMSPEQARGQVVDRRTDLWALGVLMYECLTGTGPFDRESTAECLAAIFASDADLEALPAGTPTEVASLIARCLRKNPRQRQRDAGDCALILEDARETHSTGWAEGARAPKITEGRYRVSDELCRTLDRDGFDALLPGWEMRYADNNRDSDTLILWIPSIGGDHTTSAWRELIAASPHRMVIVCPVGMEPGVANRPEVSIENQFALVRSLAGHLRACLDPRRMVVSGYSCGSIMALRCAGGDESGELFDGVLAIEPDLQETDCFITRLFGGMDASSSKDVVKALHQIGNSCETMPEWILTHQHIVECVDKFKNDFSPLIRQGKDLSESYEGVCTGADSPFVHFLRSALERAGVVRCVFHDGVEPRRMLGEIRLMHLDNRCLGDGFEDEVLQFIPVPDHVGMMGTERLLEQLDLIAEATGSHR